VDKTNQDLYTQVELLKRDTEQFYQMGEKLDKAIDKLQDLVNSVNTMVSLQQQRLDNSDHTTDLLDKKITLIDTKLTTEDKLLNDRIQKLERFKWVLMGAAATISFIIEKTLTIITGN